MTERFAWERGGGVDSVTRSEASSSQASALAAACCSVCGAISLVAANQSAANLTCLLASSKESLRRPACVLRCRQSPMTSAMIPAPAVRSGVTTVSAIRMVCSESTCKTVFQLSTSARRTARTPSCGIHSVSCFVHSEWRLRYARGAGQLVGDATGSDLNT